MQVLLQKLLQARQFKAISYPDNAANFRIAIDTREKPDRSLNLGDVIIEDRPQRLEHRLGIGRFRGIALQVLGLGKRQLHFLRQCPREMIPSQRHVAVPDFLSVRNQQRRIVGAHIKQQSVVFLLGRRITAWNMPELVVAKKVVERQGGDLNQIDFDLAVDERRQVLLHLVALHRKQPDFGIEHESAFLDATSERLVVPDHFFERERNLLPSFVFDDLANFAGFDRRQLNEPGQSRLTGNPDCHSVALQAIARQKRVQR